MRDDLVGDLFNLLVFLQTRDVKLRGQCFLPSTTLRDLAQLMAPQSAQYIAGLHTELAANRVKFVLLLGYCAGLVAPVSAPHGRLLKPAPAAGRWLDLPAEGRAALLAQALLADEAQPAMLWAQLHLPGWRVVRAGLALPRPFRFGDVRWALLEPGLGRHETFRRVMTILPSALNLRSSDDDARPETLLHALLAALCWFGVIEMLRPSSRGIRFAPRGKSLFEKTALAVPAPRTAHPLLLSVEMEPRGGASGAHLTEKQPASWREMFELCQLAGLESSRPRSFHLNRDLSVRAFDRGLTVQAAIDVLERATGEPLPRPVSLLLHRWWRDHQRIQARHVTLIRTQSSELMDKLMSRRGTRRCIARRLAPDTAQAREDKLVSLQRRLKREGIELQANFPLERPAPRTEALTRNDWAHVYQSLLIAHVLPDVIPLAYRAPDALIREVAARLDPALCETIRTAVEALIQDSAPRNTALPHPEDDDQPPISVARVEYAINAQQWLRITYHTAGRDEVTQRDILPLQIEWRGPVLYVIAFCALRHDQRVFRFDRILSIAGAAPDAAALRAAESLPGLPPAG